MSHESISAKVKPIWTPEDYQRTRDDAARLAEQSEFDADMNYLPALADALFEFATPADLMRIAADAPVIVP